MIVERQINIDPQTFAEAFGNAAFNYNPEAKIENIGNNKLTRLRLEAEWAMDDYFEKSDDLADVLGAIEKMALLARHYATDNDPNYAGLRQTFANRLVADGYLDFTPELKAMPSKSLFRCELGN